MEIGRRSTSCYLLVEGELHRLAHRYMSRERQDHTLQTTALVNEAYLKLIDQKVEWQNRAHFFGSAAQIMRRILIDHARKHLGPRHGGGGQFLWTRRRWLATHALMN